MRNSFKVIVTLVCLMTSMAVFSQKCGISSTIAMKNKLVSELPTLIDHSIVYDPSYVKLDNMCADVPADIGVCSDVIIRAFFNADVCLGEWVYDYRTSKNLPTDTNIDHRRVRNLGPMFQQKGWEIPVETSILNFDYYEPGDIIWWKLARGIDHIGIVMEDGFVLHNIGQGQRVDVSPFAYEIFRVYRINGF